MIWDLNTRIFHLMLILTIIISIISGKFSYFYIHEISGVTLFFLILLTSLSGMFSSDDIFYDGPFVKLAPQLVGIFTNVHNILHYFLYLLIILHLSAVSYYQFFLKEKIINQMIDGKSKDKNFIQKDYPSKKNGYALLVLILVFSGPSIFYYLTNIWN